MRHFWVILAAVLLVGLAGGLLVWWGVTTTTPQPPVLALEGVDPDVARAVNDALEGVRREPRSGAAWGQLGMVLRAHRLDAEASGCFDQAAALDPDSPRWAYFRADLLLAQDFNAALPPLRRAVELADRHDRR